MTPVNQSDDQKNNLYEAILDDISSGTLKGGQRLKVSELADRFGVSTSPIREVLRQMQGEGFVEISPNRGAMVKEADASTIQNIFEVLQLLEPYFVGWFADFAQPQMVEEMAGIQDRMKQTGVQDQLTFRKLDFEFHWCICKRHYNQVAAQTWRNLRTALNVHAAELRISPVRYQAILVDHDELVAAFQSNDAALADNVIRRHIDGSFVQMSQQMRALGL